jgi:hypothetical protein
MAARIEVQSDRWKELPTQAIPDAGGVTRGEVVSYGDTVAFAFARAVPADQLGANDPHLVANGAVIAESNDVWTPVIYAEKARIIGAAQDTDQLWATIGLDVFWDVDAQEPKTTRANTDCVWIGRNLEVKGVNDTSFLIEFDGRNPARTSSG